VIRRLNNWTTHSFAALALLFGYDVVQFGTHEGNERGFALFLALTLVGAVLQFGRLPGPDIVHRLRNARRKLRPSPSAGGLRTPTRAPAAVPERLLLLEEEVGALRRERAQLRQQVRWHERLLETQGTEEMRMPEHRSLHASRRFEPGRAIGTRRDGRRLITEQGRKDGDRPGELTDTARAVAGGEEQARDRPRSDDRHAVR
jgi:hypothetical protein